MPTQPKYRFDVVVFNYKRLQSFLDNSWRLEHLRPELDRVSVVTASPSSSEETRLAEWSNATRVTARYLPRQNRGIDQYARIEYFSGEVGGDNGTASRYIFQMQDHYLDCGSSFSRWPADGRVKGDVIPDISLDLDAIAMAFETKNLSGAFCDRNDPCFFTHRGQRFITPNGGNFIIPSVAVETEHVREMCERLRSSFDNSYEWAVFAEYSWGPTFFMEGQRYLDIKRNRVFDRFAPEDFYVPNENIAELFDRYGGGYRAMISRMRRRLSNVVRLISGRGPKPTPGSSARS